MPLLTIPYMKPPPGTPINPLHPLSQGLVGYWLLNEGAGSRANDISGHGNHGTLKNMAPNAQNSGWGGSKFGGGLKFDGVDDYVRFKNDVAMSAAASSISFLLKTNSWGTVIAGEWGNNTPYIYLPDSSTITFQVATTSRSFTVPTMSIGEWYNIVLTRNDGVTRLYLNGIESSSGGQAQSGVFTFNVLKYSDYDGYWFNGSIDSVRIYNRALSAAEVKQLYHDPFCNLLRVPVRYAPSAPAAAIMNQFQNFNIGADLYNGAIIA